MSETHENLAKLRRSYTAAYKLKILRAVEVQGLQAVVQATNISKETIRIWNSQELMSLPTKAKRSPGAGRPCILPQPQNLLQFMEFLREKRRPLSTFHMVQYLKSHHSEWLRDYLAASECIGDPYKNIGSLCRDFAVRHNFSWRRASTSTFSLSREELRETKQKFCQQFWQDYRYITDENIINVDETGIYYDTPPRYLWTKIGEDTSLDSSEKSSSRLTAVLSARSNGEKLPILFIIKGERGGYIEQDELCEYPQDHLYCVQKNAWMDNEGWKYFLRELMRSEVCGPTLFVVDNFAAHVSDDSVSIVEEELSSYLCPLPKNCTSVLQPLDGGVMGPFKSILRKIWLAETSTQRTAKEKRMATIKRAIAAWNAISPEAIRSSFRKALPKVD
ncbi:hypothetical protein AeRB84_012929 [Aphanomyces euteiches]|nr:hypothetical protein AeRB84_012929 [Aphanomyces euteiches]